MSEDREQTMMARRALRDELTRLGHTVEGDTASRRAGLYIMGENDLARAIFEFHATAAGAIEAMYQGAWTSGLPPRFAVLPESVTAEDSFELLEQMRIVPLLYAPGDAIEFPELERVLDSHL